MNKRILIVGGVGILCLTLLVGVYFKMPFLPSCVLYEKTGIHCPGCGITRATRSLMQGDFAQALRLNPFVIVLLPMLVFWFSIEIVFWVKGKKYDFIRLKPFPIYCIFALVVAWFIARNIPHESFNWARPTPNTIFD